MFLNIPAAILRSYPGIGRVIIGSLINAMTQADGAFKRRALFMLDEVDLLGYMRVLEEARDRGRKYGITLMLMYQSVGQLERHFGKDGATSWIDGCAFASYAAIKALETARNVSAQCGEMTVEVEGKSRNVGWSNSNSGNRKSESLNLQRRPLIMPHEITQQMRKDEQIIIVQDTIRSAAGEQSTSGERTWMPRLTQTGSSSRADRLFAALVERVIFCVRRPMSAVHERESRLNGLLRPNQIQAAHGWVGIDAVPVDDPAVKAALKSIKRYPDLILNLVCCVCRLGDVRHAAISLNGLSLKSAGAVSGQRPFPAVGDCR